MTGGTVDGLWDGKLVPPAAEKPAGLPGERSTLAACAGCGLGGIAGGIT